MYQEKKKKIIHMSIVATIVSVLMFSFVIAMIFYEIEGEKKMPFNISKISVISTVEGIEKQVEGYLNSKDINQNNDIYIYIEKNDEYKETEVIKSIVLNNFHINKITEKGEFAIYKPTENGLDIFKNIDENKSDELVFNGAMQSDLKNMKISNQGGIIVFRYANLKVSEYLSSELQELTNLDLLKLTNVNEDNLKAEISFDFIINIESGDSFKSTLTINVPVSGIVENGKTFEEKFDFNDIKFKRVEK